MRAPQLPASWSHCCGLLLALLLLLPTSAQGQQAACPGNKTEALALLDFQAGLTAGDILGNWTWGSATWMGVVCDANRGQVVAVDLYVRGLQGTLRWEPLARLSSLQRLQLSSNSLRGTLSSTLSSSLQFLGLANNLLSQTIPAKWSLPAGLRLLDISRNVLTGSIPPSLLLPGLTEEFYLSGNNINSVIPQSLILPDSLTLLTLDNNMLSGTLPFWPTLPNLQVRVEPQRGPGFCGQVPDSPRYMCPEGQSWTLLENEVLRTCEANDLSSPSGGGGSASLGSPTASIRPPSDLIGAPPSPTILEPMPESVPEGSPEERAALLEFKDGLSSSGGLTDWLNGTDGPCDWTGVACTSSGHVIALYLSAQRLHGTVAWRALARLSELEILQLNYNSLSGTLSAPLPPRLLRLEATNNKLSGSLPASFKLPANLTELSLDFNQIEGTISNRWWLPSTMTILQLANNMLNGTIPSNWASLEAPGARMFLYNNSLNGTLPFWPALNTLAMHVEPQRDTMFCGDVPDSPQYLIVDELGGASPLSSSHLEPCPPMHLSPPPPSILLSPPPLPSMPIPEPGTSSSSTGVIVGAAIGGVLGVAALSALVWWLWVRRKRRALLAAKSKYPSTSPKDSPMTRDEFCVDLEKRLASAATSCTDGKLAPGKLQCDMDSAGMGGDSTVVGGTQESDGSDTPDIAAATPRLDSTGDTISNGRLELGGGAMIPTLPIFSADDSAKSIPLNTRGSSGNVDPRSWTFNYSDLEIVGQPIGEGSYARVFKARWRDVLVAVKVFQLRGNEQYDPGDPGTAAVTFSSPVLESLRKESQFCASLRHPHIVGFLGVCSSPPCLVQEFCHRGSLAQVLQRVAQAPDPQRALSWPRRLQMLLDAAKGMAYLHLYNPSIVHRDLKTPNLLVDLHWRVKVSDFNLSKMVEGDHTQSSQTINNPRWLAPEILAGQPSSTASDVFAFGIILWEMLALQLPWGDQTTWQIVSASTSGRRPEIPEDLSTLPGGTFPAMDAYIKLMQQCWAQEPAERPPFPDIVVQLRMLLVSCAAEKAALTRDK